VPQCVKLCRRSSAFRGDWNVSREPGVDLCKKDVYVVKTGDSAAQMKDAITKMVKLALKMVNKEEIGTPEEEATFQGH